MNKELTYVSAERVQLMVQELVIILAHLVFGDNSKAEGIFYEI